MGISSLDPLYSKRVDIDIYVDLSEKKYETLKAGCESTLRVMRVELIKQARMSAHEYLVAHVLPTDGKIYYVLFECTSGDRMRPNNRKSRSETMFPGPHSLITPF